MRPVRMLDRAWLMIEGENTPMHIGVLLTFSLPAGAGDDHVPRIANVLRAQSQVATPWDLILPDRRLRGLMPFWVHESYIDIQHHVVVHELPANITDAGLRSRVAELHARPLDPQRPLWQFHFLSPLPDNRFALLVKVHHALMDGVGGLRLLERLLTPEPTDHRAIRRRAQPPRELPARAARRPADVARETLGSALRGFARGVLRRPAGVASHPAPRCRLNPDRITARRAFATQACDRSRIKRIARLSQSTDNDVVLAICSGALTALLTELDCLPERSLVAAVPVSTRSRHDVGNGTALSFCMTPLGTDKAHPQERLALIHRSTERAKQQLGELPPGGILPYTAFLMAPFLREQLLHRGGLRRPQFNLVISNVPGPRATRYLGGSRLEAAYPLSVLFHGQALNITCVRYADSIHFGFTACPDRLPNAGDLPRYIRQSLDELERACVEPPENPQNQEPGGSGFSSSQRKTAATAGTG